MTTHDDCTGYDLAVGTATGIRLWRVDDLGRLTGLTHRTVWTPGVNTARCGRTRRTPACAAGNCGRVHGYELSTAGLGMDACREPAPCDGGDPACGCGFWAYHDGVTGSESAPGPSMVLGVVEGHGKTTVGTKGFRAQKARIVALAFPRRHTIDRTRERRLRRRGWAAAWAFIAVGLMLYDWLTDWPWWAGVLAGLLLGAASLPAHRPADRERKRNHAEWTRLQAAAPSAEAEARIRRNYPDVEFHDSIEAMKAAHPPDPMLEPTPDNDPEFWTRDAGGGGGGMYAVGGWLTPGSTMANSIAASVQQSLRRLI